MSSTDYKEPCAGIITDCISLPLSLLTITLRDGPSTVKIYRRKWKVFTKRKKNRQNRVCRGITRFDGCWEARLSWPGGCLHGGLVTRSSGVDEVTLFLLCSSARGLSACHYGWFSQLARTRNSALEREKLTALENGGKRREIQEEEE